MLITRGGYHLWSTEELARGNSTEDQRIEVTKAGFRFWAKKRFGEPSHQKTDLEKESQKAGRQVRGLVDLS